MSEPLRVIFLGSDAIALPMLNWLVGSEGTRVARLTGVVTQPDRPVGRGQKVTPNAIKLWALERGLPVWQPEKITDEFRQAYAARGADLALVMAYGHLLKDDFIAVPRLGTLNLHTSLLPRYRGASPIQSAIAGGERLTGVTLMRIVRRLDAGPVADSEPVSIAPLDTAATLEAKLAAACVPLIARALRKVADGSQVFTVQDDWGATYCRKLQKEDGVLDFAQPARALAARVNGLYPWPGCIMLLRDQRVKLGLADVPTATSTGQPGEVIGRDADGLLVATGSGVLRLRNLQRPGGRMLAADEFLRGFEVPAGTVIPSQPMPALVTTR
jgi:methionyl-tRNA formyltransferase